ncbi:MAG TPA: lamin tail domain-containing protein [Saprospiraceae bacterium]|nr:lamin tail domain-containing protein [Saprospiraceae bacterium]
MRIQLYILLFAFVIISSYRMNAQIIINEISYNPPESNTDSLEYIELYNSGTGQVDLTGWRFAGAILDTLPSTQLNGGEYFVAAIKASAMLAVFGINVHQWSSATSNNALNNTGEAIRLYDDVGNLVDSVKYADNDPWPSEADGSGPSLELTDSSSDNNDGNNWQPSSGSTGVIINGNEVLGTPGAVNSGGSSGGPAVTVEIANFQFRPKDIVVAVGDSVRWVNNEGVPHNVNGKQSVFTSNTSDFFSGAPAAGPWQFDFQFNNPGLNNYRCDLHFGGGMAGTVSVYDPNNYTDFPLDHLRLTDGTNGSNLFDGVPTRVTGVVHGINFQPTGYSFYIINGNNTGINVFSFDPGSYTVNEGDLVTVSGTIDQFNGLLEIVPDDIEVISTGNATVSPDLISEVTEGVESSHIAFGPFSIDSIVATGVSGFNVYATHYNFSDKALIRVDSDLGLDEQDIEGTNYVRGIGTQFDPSFPFNSGYQILALELQIVDAVPVLSKDAITMSPNPADDAVILNSDFELSSVEIYSIDGKSVRQQKVNANFAEINTSGLQEGLFIVKAVTSAGIWSSLLSVIR